MINLEDFDERNMMRYRDIINNVLNKTEERRNIK